MAFTFAGRGLGLLLLSLLGVTQAKAQNGGYAPGPIDRGLVIGAIAGIGAVVGIGITFLVLHNRGIATGCVSESGGKKSFVTDDKKTYSLSDSGPSLPVGNRVKLKGHKSDNPPALSFQTDKLLKDYGHCPA